jgi:hypothetical protein
VLQAKTLPLAGLGPVVKALLSQEVVCPLKKLREVLPVVPYTAESSLREWHRGNV